MRGKPRRPMYRPTVEEQPGGALRAVARCAACGREFRSKRTLMRAELKAIERGARVQDVLPNWTPAERELFFVSATCGECWGKLLPPEDDNEEE